MHILWDYVYFFLSNFPEAMFIQGATSIPDSIVDEICSKIHEKLYVLLFDLGFFQLWLREYSTALISFPEIAEFPIFIIDYGSLSIA